MNNVLSRIERDVILNNMREQLPSLKIKVKSLDENIVNHNSEGVYSIKSGSYSITKEGIIVLTKEKFQFPLKDKTQYLIFFYHKGKGLFFVSTLRGISTGFAFVIPSEIFKQEDERIKYNTSIQAQIYALDGVKNASFFCIEDDDYPLFASDTYKQITIDNEKAIINIYNTITQSNFDSIDFVIPTDYYLIPACKFLSFFDDCVVQSIQGRVLPYKILYLSDETLILGDYNNNSLFNKNYNYPMKLSIPVKNVYRKIYISFVIKNIYENETNINDENIKKRVFICKIISIKPEDKRFLFEKIYETEFK